MSPVFDTPYSRSHTPDRVRNCHQHKPSLETPVIWCGLEFVLECYLYYRAPSMRTSDVTTSTDWVTCRDSSRALQWLITHAGWGELRISRSGAIVHTRRMWIMAQRRTVARPVSSRLRCLLGSRASTEEKNPTSESIASATWQRSGAAQGDVKRREAQCHLLSGKD